MKDRRIRLVLFLISCCLAVGILWAARAPLRELIYWSEDRISIYYLEKNDRFSWYNYLGPSPLFAAKEPTALLLQDSWAAQYDQLLPAEDLALITDADEVSALVQTLRAGTVEFTNLPRYANYLGRELVFAAADGEAWRLCLYAPQRGGGWLLSLPSPSFGAYRITDEAAAAIEALFDRYSAPDLSSPEAYLAVQVEDLATGEIFALDEAQRDDFVQALTETRRHAQDRSVTRSQPETPELLLHVQLANGCRFYLGWQDGLQRDLLFTVRPQQLEFRYDYQAEVTLPTYLPSADLFRGPVDPDLVQLHQIYTVHSTALAEFLAQFVNRE